MKETVRESDDKFFLHEIELTNTNQTRGGQKRQFPEIRNDIIETLMKFVNDRFEMDEELISCADPFVKICANMNDLRNVHKICVSDLSLATLNLQYNDLVQMKLWENELLSTKIRNLTEHENAVQFNCVATVFSRIQSCTQQPADVERSVKANNLLKTSFGSSLSLETENKYMFLNYNLPSLESWNPRKAIQLWLKEKQRRIHKDLMTKDSAKRQAGYGGIFNNTEEDQQEFHENYLLEAKKNDINF